ncbi:MAG: hypothetical protein RIM99_15830 [Cyclobacteriaceae bacterium]
MLSDQDFDLIQKFLDFSLTKEEEELFHSKQKSSEDFAHQVSFQREVLVLFVTIEKAKQKEKMLVDYKKFSSVPNSSKFIPVWFGYAAAASLIFALTYFFILRFETKSNEELFLSYFEPYDGVVITRGEESSFGQGLRAYSDQNYEEALRAFSETDVDSTNYSLLNLLRGNCYLELGNIELGLEFLLLIPEDENNLLTSAAEWYSALAYLKKDEIEKSKILLGSLIDSQSVYSTKAAELLSESVFD